MGSRRELVMSNLVTQLWQLELGEPAVRQRSFQEQGGSEGVPLGRSLRSSFV